MENLNVNVVIRKKQNELTDLFFKNHNSIESSKLKEPIKLDNIFDKNSSSDEIFNLTNDHIKFVIQNGCLTILTFNQYNFLKSSDENQGILVKIAKQIFDFSEKNKEIKINLNLTCIDDQFNDILENKKNNLDKSINKSNKSENFNETLIPSYEKFKLIIKQIEVFLKSKSNKSIFYKFSLEIMRKNDFKKTTSHIYVFDIADILSENFLNAREQSKSLNIVYNILNNLNDGKIIQNLKESKFERMLQMIINKTLLVKCTIFLFVFISQMTESIESLETLRKIIKLKPSNSISQVEDFNMNIKLKELENYPPSRLAQTSFCDMPSTINLNLPDTFKDDQGNAEVINNLENEVNILKKMILKKENEDYFNLNNQSMNYLLDSGRKFKNEIYNNNNKNHLLSQSSNLLRSNCKNVMNLSTFTASKVKPFENFMSNTKPSRYGFNPENEFDLSYRKDNFKINYDEFIIKENEDLKEQLLEIKRSFTEIIKEKDNKIKNFSKIIQNNESNLNEMEINYKEINLQYKDLLEENKRKEDEINDLNFKIKNGDKSLNCELAIKIKEISQGNDKINQLYNNEIIKNNNLFIENEKISTDMQKLKSSNEKLQNELSTINNELSVYKNRSSSYDNVVNQLNSKNNNLTTEVSELKKKIVEIQKKKPLVVDKTPIATKLGKICKCELYEKRMQSNIEEIAKLNKELKNLKSEDKNKSTREKENEKNHISEYEKIIEESLNKIKELQQSLNLSQEKNSYLEKLLFQKQNIPSEERSGVSSIKTNKKFADYDLITPFYSKNDDQSFLDDIIDITENDFTKRKRMKKDNLNEIFGIVTFNEGDRDSK